MRKLLMLAVAAMALTGCVTTTRHGYQVVTPAVVVEQPVYTQPAPVAWVDFWDGDYYWPNRHSSYRSWNYYGGHDYGDFRY